MRIIAKMQAPMWLIRGEEKIVNKEIELIMKTKKTLNMRIGFIFDRELEPLKIALNNLSRENIVVNILASPDCIVNNKKIDIKKEFKAENIHIYYTDLPFVKMIIRDGIEMFHIYSKFKNERVPLENTSIGMWNQYEDICKNYDKRFIKAIKKSQMRNKKGKK
jgi:sugar-specific transcriptional regulator TrmB